MKQLEFFASSSQENQTATIQPDHWKLFIDGASRNNPGPAGAGMYILKNSEFFDQKGYYLGIKTNNQAEYLALLLGLFNLKKHVKKGDCIHVVSDSELLVRHLQGKYRVKSLELKPLFSLAQSMMQELKAEIFHVLRIDNKQADQMANKGIDKKIKVSSDFILMLSHHGISW